MKLTVFIQDNTSVWPFIEVFNLSFHCRVLEWLLPCKRVESWSPAVENSFKSFSNCFRTSLFSHNCVEISNPSSTNMLRIFFKLIVGICPQILINSLIHASSSSKSFSDLSSGNLSLLSCTWWNCSHARLSSSASSSLTSQPWQQQHDNDIKLLFFQLQPSQQHSKP